METGKKSSFNKEKFELVVRGELSLYERDMLIRELGRRGLSAEIAQLNHETPEMDTEPRLGYATYENLVEFVKSNPEYLRSPSFRPHTRLWNGLARYSKASSDIYDVTPEKRGKIVLGSEAELTELFLISPNAGPRATVGDYEGRSPIGYSLNLDTLERLVYSPQFRTISNFGNKIERFTKHYIELQNVEFESRIAIEELQSSII